MTTMRILVVSNLYPPHHIGGYELGCRDVVESLRRRGHEVGVIAGNFRRPEAESIPDDPQVERILHCISSPEEGPIDDWDECRKFSHVVRKFTPDLVYFWNQGGLSPWLSLAARLQRRPIAFFLSDTNFISWRFGAWLARVPVVCDLLSNTFLVRGIPVLSGQACHFASDFLRRVALEYKIRPDPAHSIIAHWGIDVAQFSIAADRENRPLARILYVGQVIPQKGVHTAIRAFAKTVHAIGDRDLTFSIVGGGVKSYHDELVELVCSLELGERVRFHGMVPRVQLPRIYAEHDILLFPSEWQEPFAITPLEAMAAGLGVVGTTTGGSPEIFRDRENALTYQAGDIDGCSRALTELVQDRALFAHVTRNARQEIQANFTLAAMTDRIERALIDRVA